MCESTFSPLFILWSPDGIELALILIVVLLLFGANRLPNLARGMGAALSSKGRGRRQQRDEDRPMVGIVVGLLIGAILLSALALSDFSDEQKLVLGGVLLSWAAVGYWCFGGRRRL
jgi:TatA/E family protein of Tat protein translocase